MAALDSVLGSPFVRQSVTVLVTGLVVFTLVRLLRRAVRVQVSDVDLRHRATKVIAGVGYLIVGVVVVAEIGGRMSGLTVALGAASAGIAFALQEVIASVAGWLAIALGGFYRVGERVQLGGIKGDVIDIGLVRTTIMEIGGWVNGDLYNGRIVKVANSFVFKEPVFNYSADYPFLWDEITIPIRYGSDWKHARAMLAGFGDEVRRLCAELTRGVEPHRTQVPARRRAGRAGGEPRSRSSGSRIRRALVAARQADGRPGAPGLGQRRALRLRACALAEPCS